MGEAFPLPFTNVLNPIPSTAPAENQESDFETGRLNAMLVQASLSSRGPVALVGRFVDLGLKHDNDGIRHTVFFTRRPVTDSYFIEEDVRVSGYLSYSYLRSGSIVVGLVFSTDASRTEQREYKLCSRGNSETPAQFTPNFNLEKMGLLMFVADDSTTLVIPNDVDSGLVVRID